MAFPPSVLLLDDGELDDVRRLLGDLDVDFVHLRGASISDGLEPPRDLLLTTARRAQTIPRSAPADSASAESGGAPVRVVVANEEAETLRERLRRNGVDFLVRRPVHSEALRLLILRALYRGPEKRRGVRVPFGVSVECRVGATRCEMVLAELSIGGCRLIAAKTPQAVEPGMAVVVTIPAEEEGQEPLSLFGTVLRVHASELDREECSVAVAFEALDAVREAALARALLRRAVDPSVAGSDRRLHERRAFEETVRALGREAGQAFVGRDLSLGGMRVDPHPELAVGDALTLELFGFAGSAPARVRATVVRDDGDDGLALRFDEVPAEVARRLEEIVTALPSIEPLAGGEAAAMGTVVSRIVADA